MNISNCVYSAPIWTSNIHNHNKISNSTFFFVWKIVLCDLFRFMSHAETTCVMIFNIWLSIYVECCLVVCFVFYTHWNVPYIAHLDILWFGVAFCYCCGGLGWGMTLGFLNEAGDFKCLIFWRFPNGVKKDFSFWNINST